MRAPFSTGIASALLALTVATLSSAQTMVSSGFGETDDDINLRDSSVGYIDTAVVASQVRFRYDSAYSARRLSRAEFIYAAPAPFGPGLPNPERNVDYQDFLTYVEFATKYNVSAFIEMGPRAINPENNLNAFGIADITAGSKVLLLGTENSLSTFQMKFYFPSGDASHGLGTGHVSAEPGFLFYHRFSDRFRVESEVKDWIAIGGTPGIAGNVLRYGVGAAYDVYSTCSIKIAPTAEFVGWSVLDGKVVLPQPPGPPTAVDATDSTIINAKLGVRTTFFNRHQLYAGWGRALTGGTWYDNLLRIEYRLTF